MDQAGDGVFELRLHRHHIAVGADGDDGLLEVLGLVGGEDPLQNITDLGLRGPDVAADGGQLAAGRVGQLVLPDDGVGDGLLQEAVGGEGAEQVGDGSLFLPGPVVLDGAGAPQHGGHLQQLPGVQAPPHIRPVEAGPHGLDAGEAGAPPLNEHLHRGGGFLLGPLYVVRVGHGPQGQTALLPLLGGSAGGQLLQHPGELQGGDGFFKQVGHHTCVSCLC